MRKCEGSGEVAETGVKMPGAAPVASASAEESRKRKVGCGGELSYATSLFQLRSRRCRVDDVKPENSTENAEATNSDDPCASCCSSNGSSELDNDTSEFVDLEVEVEEEEEEGSFEIATSTYELENCCRERRETTPSSELESTTEIRPPIMSSVANSSRWRRPTHEEKKMPSKAELEEFFSAAEKNLQQKFAQKYNFDIVKEEALEGRYEWVRVKPRV